VRLSQRLDAISRDFSEQLKSQWPLEEMRGEDLVALARNRIDRRLALPTKLEEVDPQVWVKVDSFSVAQGITYLAARLKDEFQIREVRFRLTRGERHGQLDILWRGAPLSLETVFAWENDPFQMGGEASPLTWKQVVARHAGEAWYRRDLPAQTAYFRLLLPLAAETRSARAARTGSRPEFYDFDLFKLSAANTALDERLLSELSYTVFDTETTGLDPSQGDEIIAIGAARIINGRLLSEETFDQLIDPRRALSQASIAVHGITPERLVGQPTIEAVLPRFRRFVEDTVLVGHNAAFDMRFLQLKEAQTGVVFDQPVLDTLLLSAVIHPSQESHSLEAIAQRLGVEIVHRHTALGDAVATGEVFLRMLPLLAAAGIDTLGKARAAAQRTYYARVSY
jgi:DNA polymerase-3 subunit epsilon